MTQDEIEKKVAYVKSLMGRVPERKAPDMKLHRKAQRAGQKADKNWEMADKPSLTKGYKAYQKALSKHKK